MTWITNIGYSRGAAGLFIDPVQDGDAETTLPDADPEVEGELSERDPCIDDRDALGIVPTTFAHLRRRPHLLLEIACVVIVSYVAMIFVVSMR